MKHFLLIYDRLAGSLLELKEFDDSERSRALSERFSREIQERGSANIEVVLLGAESLDALKHTHSRYFQSAAELTEKLG